MINQRSAKTRGCLTYLIGIGVGIYAGSHLWDYYINDRQADHGKKFGTVDKPTYTIIVPFDPKVAPFPAKIDNLLFSETFSDDLSFAERKLPEMEERLATYKTKLNAGNPQAIYNALREIEKQTPLSLLEPSSRLIEFSSFVTQLATLAQDPESITNRLFYEMTGKSLTDYVIVTKEEDPRVEGKVVHGYHSPSNNTIVYKDRGGRLSGGSPFCDILHEYGHVIAQHLEQNGYSHDASILDEASAEAFCLAGAYTLSQDNAWKDLAAVEMDVWEDDTLYRTRDYAFGIDDKFYHNEASALTLATFQVLEDPYATYNYLATVEDSDIDNLDSRIWVQMEENVSIMREYFDRSKAVEYKLKNLNAKNYDLRLDCIALGAKATKEDKEAYHKETWGE